MLKIELLSENHDREAFDCGEPALNEFLRKTARQHIRKGISRTFVLIDETTPNTILGFFTLTACEVHSDQLSDKYRKKYPLIAPAAKLARMAVHLSHQRKKYGTIMMINAIERILIIADHLGIIGFFVDAKNEDAKAFYQQFGSKQAIKDDRLTRRMIILDHPLSGNSLDNFLKVVKSDGFL